MGGSATIDDGAEGDTRTADPAGPPVPAGAALRIGSTVGRYVILSVLGEGGMARVYAAYDPQLDRKIALKLLHQSMSETMEGRLLREAKAMAQLPHPNVVPVHDVGTDRGAVFIAMELIDGETVASWVKRARRTPREVIAVFREAGLGLAAAHAVGLVHRDVKPSNLLIDKRGRVQVTDFGIVTVEGQPTEPHAGPGRAEPPHPKSAANESLSTPLTEHGMLLGTPAFMAPEQFDGRADARADQFGFCASLYWALCGALPFPPRQTHSLPPLREPRPDAHVPRFVRRVLARGMAREPSARYPSMDALLADLAADPWRTWRPFLAVAGALAMVAVAVVGDRALRARQTRQCVGAEAQLAGAWDADRRDAVRTAFAATGVGYAGDSFARVGAALDDYARSWAAMRQVACEATRVRGEQSEELLDLRMECLDKRREELKELGELMGHADAELVGRAVQAAQLLTPIDRCANVATLKEPVAPLPGERVRVAELARGVARVHAMGAAGKWADGLATTKPLVEEARHLAYAPVLAESLYELGYLFSRNYEDKEAEAAFREAIVVATEGRTDLVAAQATTELVQTLGTGEEHFGDAIAWSKLGFAWLRRIGGDDLTEAKLHAVLGNLYEEKNDFPEARRHHAAALALREKRLGPDSMEVMQTLVDSCAVALNQGKLEEAETLGRRGWEIQKRIAPHHPLVAITENALADVLYAEGHYDEALVLYRGALTSAERELGSEHYFVAISAMHIGAVDVRLGSLDEAQEMLHRALDLQQKIWGADHEQVASAKAAMGWLDLARGDFGSASKRFEEALLTWKTTLGENHPDVAGGLGGLGIALVGLHRESEALAPLQRARAIGLVPRGPRGDVLLALARATAPRDPAAATAIAAEGVESYRAAGEPEAAKGRAAALAFVGK